MHLENKIKNLFGYQIETKNIENIVSIVNTAIDKGILEDKMTLEEFTNENFYNFGNAKEEVVKFLTKNS